MVAVDDNTKEQFCGSRLENTKGITRMHHKIITVNMTLMH